MININDERVQRHFDFLRVFYADEPDIAITYKNLVAEFARRGESEVDIVVLCDMARDVSRTKRTAK